MGFLAVTKLDGTNGDCARTTGILNPLLSAAGTACHGYRGYEAQTFRRRGYIVNVGYAEDADNCDATADAINQKIAGAAVVAKVACTASGYIGNMLFVPGDITACKPVACALNDVVGAFDPDCPVPTAAPAFTQITQTVVQTVPGVDSAATFNADPNVKSAYQKAYGSMIGITDTDSTTNAVTYKTGCSVDAYATDARRAAMNVKYISVVSDTSGVDTTTASNGVTDTASFATAVATVVASDTVTYSSVTAPSASDITSVSTTTSVSISGGTAAPTSGSSDNDSDLTTFIIIVAVVGAVIIIALVVVAMVKLSATKTQESALHDQVQDTPSSSAGPSVGLQTNGQQLQQV